MLCNLLGINQDEQLLVRMSPSSENQGRPTGFMFLTLGNIRWRDFYGRPGPKKCKKFFDNFKNIVTVGRVGDSDSLRQNILV